MLQSLSRDVLSLLQQGGRSLAGEGGRARRALAGIEIALAVLLLVTATLVTRTFLNLRAVDVGFNADRVLAFDVPQPTSRYPDARASLVFADRLLPRLSTLPGVERAASVLLQAALGRRRHGLAGDDRRAVADRRRAESVDQSRSRVARLLRDDGDSPPRRAGHQRRRSRRPCRCAVVSQSFARRFWPDGRALGRRLQFPLPGSPYDRQWFTVVGIVGDAKYRELRGSRLDLYISSAQCPYPVHQFVVRTAGRPDSIVGAIRAEVRAIDPALPIDDVVVLSDAVQSQIANPRLVALTFNGFAATASALAALGLGTLIAWQVRLRTREIGVRLALGATPRQVIAIVMSESIPVVAGGVVAGLAGGGVTRTIPRDAPLRGGSARSAQCRGGGQRGGGDRAVESRTSPPEAPPVSIPSSRCATSKAWRIEARSRRWTLGSGRCCRRSTATPTKTSSPSRWDRPRSSTTAKARLRGIRYGAASATSRWPVALRTRARCSSLATKRRSTRTTAATTRSVKRSVAASDW